MITRKIGKLIRGSATPFQIVAACLLGSFLAFIPGLAQAPGLLLAWLALLIILNANLFLAGLVGVAAKLVALLIAPVSFNIGRWLLEGPLRGLFETLVNAPVFAWFGFEYPLVTGGQFVALIFGTVTGILIVRAIRGSWRKLATLEKDSAAFQLWSQKRWVKVSSFLFVGGLKGKTSYEELLARKFGNPIRVLGVVLVVLLMVVGWVGAKFFDDAIVTALIRSNLETVNGATVDLENASLDPVAGSLTLTALAMCDPDNLATNLFAAQTIEAKLSTSDLLRKRATVDLVTVSAATTGEPRAVPGQRLAPEAEEEDGKWKLPDMKSMEDVLKNADVWKERLATLRRWIEKFSGAPAEETAPGETGPTYEDILRERIRLAGYANYFDAGLIQDSPTVLVRRIEANDVKAASMPEERFAITADNISTQPQFVPEPPRVSIRAASGKIVSSLALEIKANTPVQAQLELLWKGLSVDELAAQMKTEGDSAPVKGGTADVATKGIVSFVDSNLPLNVTLHDTTLQLGGTTRAVRELSLPLIEVRGPIDQPSIKFDASAWQKALGGVVKDEIKRRATEEIEKAVGGEAGGLLDGLLNRKKKPKDGETSSETKPAPAP